MSFKEIARQVEHSLQALELNVLIWGTGEGYSEHYAKRVKIRQEVRQTFHRADVQFSEDLGGLVLGADYLSLYEQELWHLAICDACVVLDTSKGAGEEIAHFINSRYAHKLLIFTHVSQKDVSTFPASLRKAQNQFFYSDQEYEDCSLVKHVLARLMQVALLKMSRLPAYW